MAVTVAGLPPGISEWNRIKHRRLADILQKWRSKSSVNHQVVIRLIGATTTRSGVSVTSDTDHSLYPKGIKITDADAAFDAVNIVRNAFHGDWNCTIYPNPKQLLRRGYFASNP